MIVVDWSKYAPYITKEEMACKHTGKCLMQAHFLDILLAIRLEYGKPLKYTSAFRDVTHPIEARKAKPGEHSDGTCVDVAINGAEAFKLMAIAIKHGIKRVGVKQDNKGTEYLHLGIGGGPSQVPTPSLWSY